ncbi:MAG TPA: hypothetical protein VFO77_10615, partial [Actinoplanes sp.]|nr:hypothetical protein [Actinoplanes sp.]
PVQVQVEPIAAHVVADRGTAAAAAVESWAPAAGARASVRRDEASESRPARSVRRDEQAPAEYRAKRSVQREDEEPAEYRAKRSVQRADEEPAEYRPKRSVERDYDDEPVAPRRRSAQPELRETDEAPVRTRRDVQDDELATRRASARRRDYDDDDRYDEAPRRRRSVEADVREPQSPEPALRQRWSADDEAVDTRSRPAEIKHYSPDPRERAPRYAEQEELASRGRRNADVAARYDQVPGQRRPRYADDVEFAPRSRRAPVEVPVGRAAVVDYGDRGTGRHSLRAAPEHVDVWRADGGVDPNYLEPDETPTLIDMAARRARRVTAEVYPGSSRDARRWAYGEEAADELYFRQLRGEAQ